MKVKFISLASGSSGNCYYIGTENYGILIDAGIAVRTIKKGLKDVLVENNISPLCVQVLTKDADSFIKFANKSDFNS